MKSFGSRPGAGILRPAGSNAAADRDTAPGPNLPARRATVFRAAPRRLNAGTVLLALIGNATLLLLGWLGLFIPDSHTWQFTASVLLGLALVAGFLALHVTLMRRLYWRDASPIWQSGLILAGWLLLGAGLQHAAGLLLTNVGTRAGFWNSQLSPHNRAVFTYDRLIAWQTLGIEALTWVVIPALLLPFLIETQAHRPRPWSTAARLLSRPLLWLTIAIAWVAAWWTTGHLLAWHPAYSTAGELLSAAVRILLAYTISVCLILLTLATVGELLAREHLRRNPFP